MKRLILFELYWEFKIRFRFLRKERHKQTRSQEFFNAEEDDLVKAYLRIPVREKEPHFDSLFEFLINVRRYADAYQKSGELWKAFGDCDRPNS